jgi:hypothetical protein
MVRESDYYIWLRDLVGDRGEYKRLIKTLDTTAFAWFLTSDENRSAGGINLRGEYAYETSTDDEDSRIGPCTVLEMLISVARHMEDQIGNSAEECFWMLIHNLTLDRFTDDNYNSCEVEAILKTWLYRNYNRDGTGSIFPLKHYRGDCRNLDIWSQMNAWIAENYPVDNSWLEQ